MIVAIVTMNHILLAGNFLQGKKQCELEHAVRIIRDCSLNQATCELAICYSADSSNILFSFRERLGEISNIRILSSQSLSLSIVQWIVRRDNFEGDQPFLVLESFEENCWLHTVNVSLGEEKSDHILGYGPRIQVEFVQGELRKELETSLTADRPKITELDLEIINREALRILTALRQGANEFTIQLTERTRETSSNLGRTYHKWLTEMFASIGVEVSKTREYLRIVMIGEVFLEAQRYPELFQKAQILIEKVIFEDLQLLIPILADSLVTYWLAILKEEKLQEEQVQLVHEEKKADEEELMKVEEEQENKKLKEKGRKEEDEVHEEGGEDDRKGKEVKEEKNNGKQSQHQKCECPDTDPRSFYSCLSKVGEETFIQYCPVNADEYQLVLSEIFQNEMELFKESGLKIFPKVVLLDKDKRRYRIEGRWATLSACFKDSLKREKDFSKRIFLSLLSTIAKYYNTNVETNFAKFNLYHGAISFLNPDSFLVDVSKMDNSTTIPQTILWNLGLPHEEPVAFTHRIRARYVDEGERFWNPRFGTTEFDNSRFPVDDLIALLEIRKWILEKIGGEVNDGLRRECREVLETLAHVSGPRESIFKDVEKVVDACKFSSNCRIGLKIGPLYKK